MRTLDVWVSIGSTYTYLTVMRVEAAAAAAGVPMRWRPFSVRTIMVEQKNIPFRDKPVKAAYMWRDIERRAAARGRSPKLPAPYPLPGLDLANQVATVAVQEGWGGAYVRAAYRLWFDEGQPAGEDPNLSAAIAEAGHDPARVIPLAGSEATLAAYRAATAEAMALGVFGAPSFVVEGEVFWGDDRLEDALGWARDGRVTLA
jgi:2-hydroxychromene-2-carboxylate isomerase